MATTQEKARECGELIKKLGFIKESLLRSFGLHKAGLKRIVDGEANPNPNSRKRIGILHEALRRIDESREEELKSVSCLA